MLPFLNDAITKLVSLGMHLSKLEYHDNDSATRDAKKILREFKEGELNRLQKQIFSVREEVVKNKYNQKKQRKDDTAKKTMGREISQEREPVEASNDGGKFLHDE